MVGCSAQSLAKVVQQVGVKDMVRLDGQLGSLVRMRKEADLAMKEAKRWRERERGREGENRKSAI